MECTIVRSSRPEVSLRKGVLKICSKCTGEHLCRSAISIKLQSNFIEIVLRHGCSPINVQHIFRTPFPRNTSGCLLLYCGMRYVLFLLQLIWPRRLYLAGDMANLYSFIQGLLEWPFSKLFFSDKLLRN